MPAPPQPNLPLYPANPNLYLFSAEQRGPNDPPFIATRRPKYWKDPDAASLDPATFVSYSILHLVPGTATIVEIPIYMPAGEAATTNFPDLLPPGATTLVGFVPPAAQPAWEFPVRALLPNEQLLNTPFGLEVRRTDLEAQAGAPTGWTTADEGLLRAIAAALGVKNAG